ncbi:MAG: CYTH domain-containing protein [Patescibacteria group bacterium]
MHSYEVEVKSLLGSKERAEEVRKAMRKADPGCALISRNKQLNHYFVDGSLKTLVAKISPHLLPELAAKLRNLAGRASEFSIRSRQKDDAVLLVLKVSVGDDSSANGISRIEFEEKISVSLDTIDKIILASGFKYQAKWSREREEYLCRGINVTLDKNAGYGWLAEFERVVEDRNRLAIAEKQVRALMKELGVEELPQDRLERMFAFYNKHWEEYYGTDNIFVIE